MLKFNKGWRQLTDKYTFWYNLKQDLKDMFSARATSLDWVILWISVLIAILLFIFKNKY